LKAAGMNDVWRKLALLKQSSLTITDCYVSLLESLISIL
jgi:hypothetical protein